jgi:hypothetical protein
LRIPPRSTASEQNSSLWRVNGKRGETTACFTDQRRANVEFLDCGRQSSLNDAVGNQFNKIKINQRSAAESKGLSIAWRSPQNNSQRAEQSFGTIVTSDAPGEPPSPSPSIHSASNPGCSAVGVHSFQRFALAWHIATIRLGVFSSEASTDWNRVEGNWKQAQDKIKQKWGKLTDDDLIQINGQRGGG